uniref:Uncharacterized protein n=1 Tax=Cucumis melo TaxID=3656 RepID=A0A9I9EJ90_CUCME
MYWYLLSLEFIFWIRGVFHSFATPNLSKTDNWKAMNGDFSILYENRSRKKFRARAAWRLSGSARWLGSARFSGGRLGLARSAPILHLAPVQAIFELVLHILGQGQILQPVEAYLWDLKMAGLHLRDELNHFEERVKEEEEEEFRGLEVEEDRKKFMQSQPLYNLGATSTGFSSKPGGFLVFSDALSIQEVHKSNQKLYLRTSNSVLSLFGAILDELVENLVFISSEIHEHGRTKPIYDSNARFWLLTGQEEIGRVYKPVEIELPLPDTLPTSAESSGSNSSTWLELLFYKPSDARAASYVCWEGFRGFLCVVFHVEYSISKIVNIGNVGGFPTFPFILSKFPLLPSKGERILCLTKQEEFCDFCEILPSENRKVKKRSSRFTDRGSKPSFYFQSTSLEIFNKYVFPDEFTNEIYKQTIPSDISIATLRRILPVHKGSFVEVYRLISQRKNLIELFSIAKGIKLILNVKFENPKEGIKESVHAFSIILKLGRASDLVQSLVRLPEDKLGELLVIVFGRLQEKKRSEKSKTSKRNWKTKKPKKERAEKE